MKTEIIAEIGSNWEGSISKAQKIIEACKDANADGVKFQMWRASDLYKKSHPNWKEIKKSELTYEKAKEINNFCKKMKIEFFCSAFYPEAIDFLESIKTKRYKIASRTCLFNYLYSSEVLKKKAATKKPIIISMGMGGDKKRINNIFSKNQKTFCYCISEYPLDFKKIDWKKAIKFDGFSDHTAGIDAPIVFTTLKKFNNSKSIYIEKHVKLRNSKGPDASTSMDTEKLKEMISHIRVIEK